ncbi:4-hydroxy-2-oxoglutarate aldolase @ 2-dehydro-3-deoxyphosphogluconate aldolase [Streptomyces misionensis JCM 4497]
MIAGDAAARHDEGHDLRAGPLAGRARGGAAGRLRRRTAGPGPGGRGAARDRGDAAYPRRAGRDPGDRRGGAAGGGRRGHGDHGGAGGRLCRRRGAVPGESGVDAVAAGRHAGIRGAVPARGVDRLGGGRAAGARGAGHEVLPGAGGGRHGVSEVAGGAVAAGPVLPDRRDRPRDRAGVSGAAQRRLCGRELDGAGGCGGRAGLGPDRGAGARRGRAQRRWDVSLKRRTLALPSA